MRGWTSHLRAPLGWGMIDMQDPRGIITFIVRYLMLQVGLLVLLVLSLSSSLVLLTIFCLMGFFTFFQVLASISRDFLDHAGLWKAIVIAVTVLTDVPILWWLVVRTTGGGHCRQRVRLVARDFMDALPLLRCLLCVADPRDDPHGRRSKYCRVQRPCQHR